MCKKYLLLGFFFIATGGYCQRNTETIIQELNLLAVPIQTLNPEDGFDDIMFLREDLKDEKIIGLGESTHGTSIYDRYRQRLIRFLVQEMGYKAIVDEGDMLAAEKLDAYINGAADSIEFIGNIQPVIANRKILRWLRSYNKDKPEAERVHIYGAEVRGFFGILGRIKDFSLFKDDDKKVLDKFTGDVGVGYKNLDKADFNNLKQIVERRAAECASSVCKRYLSLLNQQIDVAWRYRFGRNDFNVRDEYMF